MRNRLWLAIWLLSLLFAAGCAMAPHNVVVTADEKIYTLPAGQEVKLLLNNQPVNMTFQTPMKVVSADTIVACEEKLNNQQLDKTDAKKKGNAWMGIVGSLLAIIAAGVVAWKKLVPKTPSK